MRKENSAKGLNIYTDQNDKVFLWPALPIECKCKSTTEVINLHYDSTWRKIDAVYCPECRKIYVSYWKKEDIEGFVKIANMQDYESIVNYATRRRRIDCEKFRIDEHPIKIYTGSIPLDHYGIQIGVKMTLIIKNVSVQFYYDSIDGIIYICPEEFVKIQGEYRGVLDKSSKKKLREYRRKIANQQNKEPDALRAARAQNRVLGNYEYINPNDPAYKNKRSFFS